MASNITGPCCKCRNQGKCKSCICTKTGKGCDNDCANPNCQLKNTSQDVPKVSRRIHPYAQHSTRNKKTLTTATTQHTSVTTTSAAAPSSTSAPSTSSSPLSSTSALPLTSAPSSTSPPPSARSSTSASPPPTTSSLNNHSSSIAPSSPAATSSSSATSTSSACLSRNEVLQQRVGAENDTRTTQFLMTAIHNMTGQQRLTALTTLVQQIPQDVMCNLLRVQSPTPAVSWCVCGRCRSMEQPRMNLCCGQGQCIISTSTFYNVCQRSDVLEIANILNWSFQFNDDPSFEPTIFRNQAYRNFVLWQWGMLGPGNRRIIPSCVVLAIRARFPRSDGTYSGYHSSEEF